MDIHSLDRFIEVQERMYAVALEEIKSGLKRSHWMWYIFPQLRGLGTSSMAHVYGIAGLDEARAYLSHPVLSARLIEISEALLMLKKKNPEDIFGHTDAMKLRSSMTLFALVSDDGSGFHEVLEWFYNGRMDERTLELIKSQLSDDEQIDLTAKCILEKYRKVSLLWNKDVQAGVARLLCLLQYRTEPYTVRWRIHLSPRSCRQPCRRLC